MASDLISRRDFAINLAGRAAAVTIVFTLGKRLLREEGSAAFEVKLQDRTIRLSPDQFVDPFLGALQGERMLYYQLQFPSFILGIDHVELVKAVQKECDARFPAAEKDVYRNARLRALPAATAASLLSSTSGEATTFLQEVIVQLCRSSLDKEQKPNRIVLETVWQNLTAALIRNSESWNRFEANNALLSEASDVCLRFLQRETETLPLIWAAVSAWQFLLTYEGALLERRDDEGRQRVRAFRNTIERAGGERFVWLDRLRKLYRDLKTREDMFSQVWESLMGRPHMCPGTREREVANYFAVLGVEGNFYNEQAAKGVIPQTYLKVGEQDSLKVWRKAQTFFANYQLTREGDWSELQASAGDLLSEDAAKYGERLFTRPLRPGDEDDNEKREQQDAKLFSRLCPFRKWDESVIADILFGKAAKARNERLFMLELLAKGPDDEDARLKFHKIGARYGATMEINGGDRNVPDEVIEQEISKHPIRRNSAYKEVIGAGAEAAKDELKQKITIPPARHVLAGIGVDVSPSETKGEINMNTPEKNKIGEQRVPENPLPVHLVRGIAGKFIFTHLRDLFAAGSPKLLERKSGAVWIVPVAVVSEGSPPHPVGELVISATSGEILSHTVPDEVLRRAHKPT